MPAKGGHHTEEAKQKIREFHKGKKLSEEHIQKLRESHKGQIPWIKGKKHTIETIQKMRERRKGRLIWNKGLKGVMKPNQTSFKKGLTPWNKGLGITASLLHKVRSCLKYRQWRSDVFTRDDFTCQDCDRRGGLIEAHHPQSFSDIMALNDVKTLAEAEACEELWNINNGITLCKKCHKKRHGKDYNTSA